MRWITEIRLDNYRAFKDAYAPIVIPTKKHLLIYGENGSGKSSIYNSIKDFFNSSTDATKPFEVNLFSRIAGIDVGTIKLKIADIDTGGNVTDEKEYIFGKPDSQSNHRIAAITVPNKVKGFLDYKNVLETYFKKGKAGQNPNIFYLLIENLLSNHLINRAGGGVATYPLGEEWKRIREPIYKKDRRYRAHRAAVSELPAFEGLLRNLLIQVFTEFKKLIKTYFDPKLDIDVTLSPMTIDYSKWKITEELKLEIRYAGEQIPSYDIFLNEARLSAIGISIYLAALKTYPPTASDLKILFLDDVFIGLDTSNRFPLLELINEEFIKNDFQIFISTYDREWFEMVRHWLSVKNVPIKCLELYVEDNDDLNIPDYPIIILHQGNFEKAKAYYKAKDYPAAGNYIRKECESLIRNILPDTYKIDSNGHIIDDLETLMLRLEEYYCDCGIKTPQELIDTIKIYRKALLNPSSHSDIKSQLFKREINDAFEIVNKLKVLPEIKRTQIFHKGDTFRYENPGINYVMQIELATNLFLIEYNGTKSFSKHTFRIKSWSWNSIEFATDYTGTVMPADERDNVCEEKRTLEEIFKGIAKSTKIVIPQNLYAEMKIGTTGTLQDSLV